MAIVAGDPSRSSYDFEGAMPPIFIISERLYIMED
jgi:hypothetical protein